MKTKSAVIASLGAVVFGAMFSSQATASATDPGGVLVIVVNAVASDTGKVCADVFASKDGWPEERGKALRRSCVKPSQSRAEIAFKDLPVGTYAAFVFHDQDGNGAVLKNWIGMPKEGVGASNNKGGIGGPAFEKSAFRHQSPKTAISVQLKYL